MDDETIEVPLPRGTLPNPDLIITQKIPKISASAWASSAEKTLVISTVPVRFLNDPILTMPAPVADRTPLFDQLNGKPHRPPRPVDRKASVGDKVLLCLSFAVVIAGAGVYGMVTHGWGDGGFPVQQAIVAPPQPSYSSGTVPTSPGPSESVAARQAPVEREAVVLLAPHTYRPTPTRSIVVIASPRPTPTPTPVPTTTPTASPAPSPTPSDTPEPVTSTPAAPKPVQSTPAKPTLGIGIGISISLGPLELLNG